MANHSFMALHFVTELAGCMYVAYIAHQLQGTCLTILSILLVAWSAQFVPFPIPAIPSDLPVITHWARNIQWTC